MEKNKVYDVNGNPAIILDAKDDTAVVFAVITSDNIKRATMSKVPVDSLKPYQCPYAGDKCPARIHCKNGECQYPIPEGGHTYLLYMCNMLCLNDSFDAELKETTNETNN